MAATELVLVAGGATATARNGIERVVAHLRTEEPATAVLHHDLREVARGVVLRRVRAAGEDRTTAVELVHGCVSCTLREDVLPTLHALARRADVRRVVLVLDPVVEPEQVCVAIRHVVVEGSAAGDGTAGDGAGGSTVADHADLRGVITVVDAATWLDDALGDEPVASSALARLPDDDRSVAQLVVAQAEFADVVVVAGEAETWRLVRTDAVLARLAPLAPRLGTASLAGGVLDGPGLLAGLPAGARRGHQDAVGAPLLRGQPPLLPDGDVRLVTVTARRPFHPERLHEALDVLLAGVVRARGRIWLATRPSEALWLESAGGGLEIGPAGTWLAADDDAAWDEADPEHRAAASLRWHPRWGDRVQELAVLLAGADPDLLDAALRDALLTDAELAAGEESWRAFDDPFGHTHSDPCTDPEPAVSGQIHEEDQS